MPDQQVRHRFHDAEVHLPDLLFQRHRGWPLIAKALNQGDENLVHPTGGVEARHDKGPALFSHKLAVEPIRSVRILFFDRRTTAPAVRLARSIYTLQVTDDHGFRADVEIRVLFVPRLAGPVALRGRDETLELGFVVVHHTRTSAAAADSLQVH